MTALLMLRSSTGQAQKLVAFTIDDVPNTQLYQAQQFKPGLLTAIDSLRMPVAIFINEQRLYDTDSLMPNLKLLTNWLKHPLVTAGNHGFSHVKYSEVGIETFKEDVLKGEAISAKLTRKMGKPLRYYRFPYNDLGKDELMHEQAAAFLKSRQYTIVPYTVHSEDWLIAQLYDYYLAHNQLGEARRIGRRYVAKTLAYFAYIESLTDQKLHRPVKHIYLLHDNRLNADYLAELVSGLRKQGYGFCSLDQALTDPVYSQADYYNQQYGISWVYRWIQDPQLRKQLMRQSPNEEEFETELSKLPK